MSNKRALCRSTAVTLLIWIITFYLIEYGFLPVQIYYGGSTGRVFVGIASFIAARCFMGGFVRKWYRLSFPILGIINLCLIIFGIIYFIWGFNDDAEHFVYPCLLPAILGVLTKLHWKHVLEDLMSEMEKEANKDNKSDKSDDATIEDDLGAIEFIEVAPKSKLDPLLEDVAKYVVSNGSCSVSAIQRNFTVGFNRAGRIAQQLEQAGILSPELPAQRQILINELDNAVQKIEALREKVDKKEEGREDDKETV